MPQGKRLNLGCNGWCGNRVPANAPSASQNQSVWHGEFAGRPGLSYGSGSQSMDRRVEVEETHLV